MDKLEVIRAGMQRLVPDTFEVLGLAKINRVIEYCADGEDPELIDSVFLEPEFGHPSSFMEHLQIASQCASLIVAGIKIIETMTSLATRLNNSLGSRSDTDKSTEPVTERSKSAEAALDDRVSGNIVKFFDIFDQTDEKRDKDH